MKEINDRLRYLVTRIDELYDDIKLADQSLVAGSLQEHSDDLNTLASNFLGLAGFIEEQYCQIRCAPRDVIKTHKRH